MKELRTTKMEAEGARILIRVVFLLAVAWLSLCDCGTAAADYSFFLDRFEISGQVNASDEFDDGDVAPWVIHDPTVEESGGFVSFSSPGTIEDGYLDGVYYVLEMSFIGSGYSSPFVVENGAGDFTGISSWIPIVPGVNHWYEMQVGYEVQQEPHVSIDISVGVANWDSEFAALMGIDPGLGISFYLSGDSFIWRHILISEAELTSADAILLRLDFYDATDEFRAGFSLDGGVSYQYFPELIGWGQDTPGHYEWYFSGQAIELQMIQPSPVAIDIKPGSCPNPLNAKSKGKLPVAVLGTDEFDVSWIDPPTVMLAGVSPLKWHYEDVSTPAGDDAELCECTEAGPDGYLDLVFQFDTREIVAAIEAELGGLPDDGLEGPLPLRGDLLEGVPYQDDEIAGEDCVVIRNKGGDE